MTQFKLVPVEPTREMILELMSVGLRHAEYVDERGPSVAEMALGYQFMIAAAPSPWVSVEERLPEKGQPILVPREDHHPFAGKYSPLGDLHRCLDYALGKWWEFTHWMPLPTPPEKSE